MHSIFILSVGVVQGLAALAHLVNSGKKSSGEEFVFGIINGVISVFLILHGLNG